MDKNTLAIVSYNSNGCGTGCIEYINKLCGFCDIVLSKNTGYLVNKSTVAGFLPTTE